MIRYEIYINGESNPYHSFESSYQFSTGEKVFVQKDQLQQLLVSRITHDLTQGHHVVRLTCQYKKMFV